MLANRRQLRVDGIGGAPGFNSKRDICHEPMTRRSTVSYSREGSGLPFEFVKDYASLECFLLWNLADLKELAQHGEGLIAARTEIAAESPSPYVLRSSLWVMTYAVVESWLAKVARSAQTFLNLPITPGELRGSGLKRYAVYLKKLGRIEFPDQSLAWRQLLAIGALRNAIVHDGGRSGGQALNAVQVVRHVTVEKGEDEIWLEEGAVPWAVDVARGFADELTKVVGLSRSEHRKR